MQCVPEVASLSEQQSYHLYVQASKPTQPDEDANLRNSNGADHEDQSVLSEDDHSNNSCDYQLGRRRVSHILNTSDHLGFWVFEIIRKVGLRQVELGFLLFFPIFSIFNIFHFKKDHQLCQKF